MNKDKTWAQICNLYAGDGIQDRCLILQNQGGYCVSGLLWAVCAWADGYDVLAALPNSVQVIKKWQAVLLPLRRSRKSIASAHPIRSAVLALELDVEQALIFDLCDQPLSRATATHDMQVVCKTFAVATGADENHPALGPLTDYLVTMLSLN